MHHRRLTPLFIHFHQIMTANFISSICLLGVLVLARLVSHEAVAAERGTVLRPYERPTLIAHRGASDMAPEHTLTAYRLALRQGADFVEPDLQLTRDGQLVCLHDATLERTTDIETVFPERGREVRGKRVWPVSDFTLAELKRLDAGSWKGAEFAGERIPTLQEMIDVVRGQAGILPETKGPENYQSLGLDMEARLMELLHANQLAQPGADPKTPVMIQSFSETSLRRLREKFACRLPLVFLFSGNGDTPHATRQGLERIRTFADGIGPNKATVLACPNLIADSHGLGMSVTIWTFRKGQAGRFGSAREEMDHFLNQLHADALFTDNPDLFPR